MNLKNDALPYKVGGLLYTPAINGGIAEKISTKAYPFLTSIAFCLEDSIQDDALPQAEVQLKKTLSLIEKSENEPPLLFVRVRNPEHLIHIYKFLGAENQLITGYILPKFDLSNSEQYIKNITQINQESNKILYIMPIIESRMAADVNTRTQALLNIKKQLSCISQYVLNIRVGGNDLSNLYGLRRSINQNIYQIGVIRDILVDIINIFAADYVVSAAVWEYFGSDCQGQWADGLKKELELDRLNGFIGKTAIHPSQLPIIYDSMRVSNADYQDAQRIINWNIKEYGVKKSSDASRMNEVKCHIKWAEKIIMLKSIYGVREE